MNCDSAQENIVLAQYGELPDELLRPLEQHLEGCEECRRELNAMLALREDLALDPVVEPSPNLLAASRMRLDEALDAIPERSVAQRFWGSAFRWFSYVQGAPALTVLLVGVGFLGGNTIARYQAAHVPAPRASVITSNPSGPIANISAVVQTPDPQVIQVKYNRLVPETMQGTVNDPQIRDLLKLGTTMAANSDVRNESVATLAAYCLSGSGCNADDPNGADGYRSVLVDSLRHGDTAEVRLAALHGLQPYIAQDQSVRNAVLDTLMNDQSADVRSAAISMLEPVQADSSVRRVLRSVSTQDSNAAIRTASYQALQSSGDIE